MRTRGIYLAFVASTAILAAAQILFLPRFLSPAEMALIVLGISATQFALQVADLGYCNAAADRTLSVVTRETFRETALPISLLLGAATTIIAGLLALFMPALRSALWSMAIGVVTGTVLMQSKVASSRAMQKAEARVVLRDNFVWQNAPKVGMVAAVGFASSPVVLMAGLVSSVVLVRTWRRPRIAALLHGVRLWRRAASGFFIVLSSFVLTWADTYIVGSKLGLSDAGSYQAAYRPLIAVSYLYLPLIALMQTKLNSFETGQRQGILAGVTRIVLLCASCLALLGPALIMIGAVLWPDYRFPVTLICVLSLAVLCSCLSAASGTVLLVLGDRRTIVIANIIGACSLLSTGIVLTSVLGQIGAASASLAGWAVCAAIQLIAVGRLNRSQYRRKDSYPLVEA